MFAQDLHVTNHAASVALFFEIAAIVAARIVATQSLSSRVAMLVGLGLMISSVALVTLAQVSGSMWMLIAGTGSCGLALGLGYRGSLQVGIRLRQPRSEPRWFSRLLRLRLFG